jgi:aminomuconate-semialdehyde/2-hydroxymuconate-6-semialdehyde dehydrogenase
MLVIENFIDGEFIASADGKRFETRSPINSNVVASVAEAGRADVDAAVGAARQALNGEWGKLSLERRVALIYALADEIERRLADFVEAETVDTGQPRHVLEHIVGRSVANFRIFADVIKGVSSECFSTSTPDGRGALNYTIRQPKGVIGVISPWNAPFMLMTWKVGPALACGNTVVVKPSEETPMTAVLLGEVMNAVGIPKGVYNVVNGFGPDSAGAFLTEHPDVDAITFTGETRTGEVIMRAAAKGTRDVSFEMGGKNAGVVFADCDLDAAVAGIFNSSFMNTGQVCLGTERVYVERPIFDRFVAALKEKAEGIKLGHPDDKSTNFGPLISQEHKEKVLSYYRKAAEEGATIVTGGGEPEMPDDLAAGHWVQPTIWTGLPETAAVIQEEIFGPCCHISPFDEEDEVVAKANDTVYGLSTTIWTNDLARAHRVAASINVGITWVNSWILRDLRTAFGGSGQSGIGREGGEHSLEFYTELRNVCVKL